ncbi:Fic family protein [Flavobacterium sp. K5-23]|uniref:Fic family protein n=1 Tax=Flavobacterium sp. K5-23 TaxID=2746225 RepID=UPI00200C5B76|nr:Fic family protein [Flavobacterium sp. K5-23]UQD56842.1 Fic family protein [Flavobacterium sp. K5-23]
MKEILKNARENKGLKTREVSQLLGIDQALVSKFESGTRKPTREQIIKLATLLEIDLETLIVTWLKEKIINEIGQEEFALKALKIAEEEIKLLRNSTTNDISASLQKILEEINNLKFKLDHFRQFDNNTISKTFEIEYTFESNRAEGNTLTLEETTLIINKGLTIPGKSMREHLEAINHQEAIVYIKNMVKKSTPLNERELLSIHNLILRGIYPEDAGRYRKQDISIEGFNYTPPQHLKITKEMGDYFIWYETNKNSLHPIVLAAEMQERLIKIHPFLYGNEKASRILKNLILLQYGYPITTIKTSNENQYKQALELALSKNKDAFVLFTIQIVKESMQHYIKNIAQ